jgi:hypothetical protein
MGDSGVTNFRTVRFRGPWQGRRGVRRTASRGALALPLPPEARDNDPMTERKPPGIDFETWVDRQIREAQERGAFEDLPGAGKPLPGAEAPYDENWWLKRKLRDEGVSHLPASLALRKEAEEARKAASRAGSEQEVRRIVGAVNDKIREAIRRPLSGPPLNLVPYDVERVVAEWREERAGGEDARDG